MNDYYKVLGLKPGASLEEIKAAYRKLSKKFHPDLNEGDKFFEERFKEIQEAYEKLVSENNKSQNKQEQQPPKEEKHEEKSSSEHSQKTKENGGNNSFKQKNYTNTKQNNQTTNKPEKKSFNYLRVVIFFFVVSALTRIVQQALKQKTYNDAISSYHSTQSQKDTIISQQSTEKNYTSNFFPNITLLSNTGENIDTNIFWEGAKIDFNYINIDEDNTPELFLSSWSGGSHCCMTTYIFKRIKDSTYKEIFYKDYGAEQIEVENKHIVFYLHDYFGFFHSCYGCQIDLPTEFTPCIKLNYSNNQFNYYFDKSINRKIEKTLIFLKERGIPEIETNRYSNSDDDGTRKAFFSCYVTYYYNNNCNIEMTKNLFDTTYYATDKDSVWNDIRQFIKADFRKSYSEE